MAVVQTLEMQLLLKKGKQFTVTMSLLATKISKSTWKNGKSIDLLLVEENVFAGNAELRKTIQLPTNTSVWNQAMPFVYKKLGVSAI